jgi:hypothetical protein
MRRPSRRTREAAPAAQAIAAALSARGIAQPVREHRILTEWRDMVGERIAARTWPDGLKERVLWVRVASSAWLHELSLMKAQMMAGIDRVLGPPRVCDELRLHLGARKQVDADDTLAIAAQARRRARTVVARPAPVAATGEAKARIERETASIADEELRELVRRVRVRNDK